MKILVVDSIAAASISIARDLNKTLGYQTLYASSTEHVLDHLRLEKDSIHIIVFFVESGPEQGLSFVSEIQEFSDVAEIRCPKFIAMTPGNLSGGYLSRFRTVGAECVVYGETDQLYATVRRMAFETKCESGKPTIVVERMTHGTRFYLLGTARRELIAYGPRLHLMMNCFAVNFETEISTERLADTGGITVGSVKVYMKRLRAGYDEAREKVGVTIPGARVFRTIRKDGGFVHILKARVLFIWYQLRYACK